MTAAALRARADTPYKGLTQFTEEDAPFFFGREEETRTIASNLLASRLTLLYGPTGVGKSSLLAAGVKHHLDERARATLDGRAIPDWVTVVFPSSRLTSGGRRDSWHESPLEAITGAIEQEVARLGLPVVPPPRAPDLVTLLNAWTEKLDAEVMLILDQFEEYFLYHGSEDGEGTLTADLPRVLRKPGMGVNVLISIRADAYAQLDRFKGRIPNVYENYLRLDHLTPERAREAITGPVDVYNRRGGRMEIEDALVDEVLAQVESGAFELGQSGFGAVASEEQRRGIETPFLQLVMEQLWLTEVARGSHRLQLATLRDLGNAESIVRAHLDAALDRLPGGDRDMAERMFGRLVTPSRTKIAWLASDLADTERLPLERVERVLAQLADDRVLRTIAAAGGERKPRYEIFHDVLAPAVLDWHTDWQKNAERARLQTQIAEQRASSRRLLLLAIAVGVAAVVAIGFALVARARTDDAKQATTRAEAERLTALSETSKAETAKLLADASAKVDADPGSALATIVRARPGAMSPPIIRTLRQALRTAALIAPLKPGAGELHGTAISPDSAYVLTYGGKRVDLWSSVDGTRVGSVKLPADVQRAAFSPDAAAVLVATGSDAYLWRWPTREQVALGATGHAALAAGFGAGGRRAIVVTRRAILEWPAGAAGHARRIALRRPTLAAIDRRGERVAVAAGRVARLFDLRGGATRTLQWPGARRTIALAFSRDGRHLAMGSNSPNPYFFAPSGRFSINHQTARTGVWDTATGRREGIVSTGQSSLTSVAADGHGRSLAYGTTDGVTHLWRPTKSGKGVRSATLRGHTGQVTSVAYSADGRLLVTASGDGDTRVWSPDGTSLATLHAHGDWIQTAAISDDGQRIVTTGDRDQAWLWRQPVERPAAAIAGASVREGDGTLALVQKSDRVDVVDRRTGAKLSAIHPGEAAYAVLADRGRRVISDDFEAVKVWRSRDGAQVGKPLSSEASFAHGDGPKGALWHGGLRRMDLESGHLERPLTHGARPRSISINRDGDLIAVGYARHVDLWDATRRMRVGQLKGVEAGRVTFAPDDRTLAVMQSSFVAAQQTQAPATVLLWTPATGRRLTLASHDAVGYAPFSSDGKLLATAGRENAARVWDVATGKVLATLQGHSQRLEDVEFSPRDELVVTASDDGSARVWDARSGELVERFQLGTEVWWAQFSADGRQILAEADSLRTYPCALCGGPSELLGLAARRAPVR